MRYLLVGLLTTVVVAGTGWVVFDDPVDQGWRDDRLPLPAATLPSVEENRSRTLKRPGKKKRRKLRRSGRARTGAGHRSPAGRQADRPHPAGISPGEVHYELGLTYLQQQKVPAAITELEKCIALDSKHALAYRALGMSRAALGKQSSAVAAFKRFVALAPTHEDVADIRAIIDAHEGGK